MAPKLGWKPTPPDRLRKVVRLARHYNPAAGAGSIPATSYRTAAAKSLATMLRNNALGCCTISAVGHQAGVDSANRPSPRELVMLDKEVNVQYPQICGAGDNGCYIPDVLDWWRDKGITIAGVRTRIAGYALVDARDVTLLRTAIYLFGAAHAGFMITSDQYQNASPSALWTADTSPIVGGHSIGLVDEDESRLQCSTWGMVVPGDFGFLAAPRAQSEVYVILSDQWTDASGMAAHGINAKTLADDLAIVKAGGVPPLDPAPTPPPPTPPPTPGPSGGQWSGDGFVNMFGQMLPIKMQGTFATATAQMGSANLWVILADVGQMIADGAAKNWAALAADVAKLLNDLGIYPTPAQAAEIVRSLQAHLETSALLSPTPPA
jgi:hypothetical protein